MTEEFMQKVYDRQVEIETGQIEVELIEDAKI